MSTNHKSDQLRSSLRKWMKEKKTKTKEKRRAPESWGKKTRVPRVLEHLRQPMKAALLGFFLNIFNNGNSSSSLEHHFPSWVRFTSHKSLIDSSSTSSTFSSSSSSYSEAAGGSLVGRSRRTGRSKKIKKKLEISINHRLIYAQF